MVKITFPDGSVRTYEQGVTGLQIAESISPALARNVVSCGVNGETVELNRPINEDVTIALYKFEDEEGKHTFWHTSAHLLAEALQELYPGIQFGFGPAIENGFFYDVMPAEGQVISENDFAKIEAKMLELAKKDEPVVRRDVSKADALKEFEADGQAYKCEHIAQDLEDGTISTYTQGRFTDLCRGPHLMSTGLIKAVKITSVGKGLPIWLPKGTQLRLRLQELLRSLLRPYHYQEVITPGIGGKSLYVTSGHYAHYGKDAFQPIHTPEEDEEYMLKPMNCPHHCEVYARKPRSYKDLPLRIAEFGTVFRYEKSGELHGLTRVRSFTQDDAHIFVRSDQVRAEFEANIDIILKVFKMFHFDNYEAQISLRDPKDKEKYIGSDEVWEESQNAIREACKEKGLTAREEIGEAAFYGPKLDFMVKDAIGRKWQLGTIQVDYNLPARFKLEYTTEDNAKQTPVMIHRAPFGSLERFTAVLIEHTAGHFPLWLTPDQVAVLPISEKYNDYARRVVDHLDAAGVRCVIDDRNEKIGRKIRDNELKRVPYMVIVGEKEAAEGLVSMRKQGGGEQATMTMEAFAKRINDEVAEQLKTLD